MKINKICWLFPILFFLMVWLTMEVPNEGTDLAAQLDKMESVQGEPLCYFEDQDEPVLFYLLYNVLYSKLEISPRFYLASLSFIYFAIILLVIERYNTITNIWRLSRYNISLISIFACLCYCPILISVARFHFAVLCVIIGILPFIFNKKILWKILGIIFAILAYYAHEGIIIIYAIILLAFIIRYLWLNTFLGRDFFVRNIIILFVSIVLFASGPFVFSIISSVLNRYDLLSERYVESYVNPASGDGDYLLVIVLCLFGSILSLLITSLYDRRNNWVTALCIAGLFMTCMFFNQKIFYVQRIFMFMPLFIGMSCKQVLSDLKSGDKRNIYIFLLLSVPAIYICQLVIQNKYFFSSI